MENSTKCPVCGKEGIPDYHFGEVRCPSCGSNLEAFRLLDAIDEENKAKASKWKPIAIASMALALLFAILYFTKGSSAPATDEQKVQTTAVANSEENDTSSSTKQAQTENTEVKPVETQENKENKAESTEEKAAETNGEITAPANLVTVKDGKKYYTVKKGDTWSSSTKKLYGNKISYKELMQMNHKTNEKDLSIDEELLVK